MNRVETQGHIIELKDVIIYMYVKPDPPCMQDLQECFGALKMLGKRYPILVDSRDGIALNKDQRSFSTSEFSKCATAVAMLNNNPLVPLIFKFITKIDLPTYPVALFKNEERAVEWLEKTSVSSPLAV